MKTSQKLLHFVAVIVALAGAVRLFRGAELDGQDFQVYWKAAHTWLSGISPYQFTSEDRGFVFKYPPWILPVLLPLGLLGYEFSKGVWAVLELGALSYCIFWLIRHGVSKTAAIVMTFLYWYIWLAHFSAGQMTLFLLAAALACFDSSRFHQKQDWKTAALTVLFSIKIFTLFALAGLWKTLLKARPIGMAILFFMTLNVLALLIYHPASYWDGALQLVQGWISAMGSGGKELGAEIIRGPGNHGLVAGILRWFDPQAEATFWDTWVSLLLAGGLGFLWFRGSRELRFEEKWAGWLAYSVIIHPLAWHHSFVMAFPLSAYSLDAALATVDSKKASSYLWVILSLFGTGLITLWVPQVVGFKWAYLPDLLAEKSWGVVLCAWILVKTRNFRYSLSQ